VVTREASDCGTHTLNNDTIGLTITDWDEGSNIPDGNSSDMGEGSQKSDSVTHEDGRCDCKSPSEMERNGKVVGVNVT
jgi:hypothetical protein